MNKIIGKEYFSEKVVAFEIEAPLIAKSRKAGNFIILRVGDKGERVPLTIAGADKEKGTIRIVAQIVGASSKKLASLNVGDYITDVVGPLGRPTDIKNVGTVLACGGGVGVAPLLPIVEAFKQAGNRVVSVIAARSEELIILKEEMEKWSDELIIMTDDGSLGEKGLITEGMRRVLERETVDEAIIIGPAIMMKFAAQLTKEFAVPTQASLNAMMVDGTGMCGACRVSVGGKTKFTCVDGPEFDAHQVDFDEMMMRLKSYVQEEKQLND